MKIPYTIILKVWLPCFIEKNLKTNKTPQKCIMADRETIQEELLWRWEWKREERKYTASVWNHVTHILAGRFSRLLCTSIQTSP